MISFRNLSDISNVELLACFNDSFSDYSIPFKLDLKQLEDKLHSEDIDHEISVGAFKENRLVGFVLHGQRMNHDSLTAYNAGTGVRPIERGQRLTRKMYDFIKPILNSKGIEKVVLEVISDNIPALKSYESIGFQLARDLNCYKAKLNSVVLADDVRVEESDQVSLKEIGEFGDIIPSWQNANKTISNLGEQAKYLLAFYKSQLCGYCIINSTNNRILQLAVKKQFRRRGIGGSLLAYIRQNISPVTSIINVDSSHEETIKFFGRYFEKTLMQKEMKLEITSR